MNSRERLAATMSHQAPDRLCVDLGAGGQTGIGAGALWRLRKELLGDDSPVRIIEPYQMLGEVDEDLRQALELDVVGVHPRCTMFGFPNQDWKPFTMNDGTPVLVPGQFNWTRGEDGSILLYPEGDLSCPPSAIMPHSSFFFDSTNRQPPLDEQALDPADNMEEFGVLTDTDVKHYACQAGAYFEQTSYGIYATLPGMGFGDIACVPAPWMKAPKGIRDVSEWYMSTLSRQDYVLKVFERQCEAALENIDLLAETLGGRVQVVFVSGTDFGHQRGTFCSIETYRHLYKPFHHAVNARIHARTPWKTFIHSCGAIRGLIPEFIDAGFDVLNPVQCSAQGMDPRELKKEFGQQLVFWGGGVDTQSTLPFGAPDEVYRQVRERIDIFAEGGGFVFTGIHNIQSNVPVENILAMFRAVKDSRGG